MASAPNQARDFAAYGEPGKPGEFELCFLRSGERPEASAEAESKARPLRPEVAFYEAKAAKEASSCIKEFGPAPPHRIWGTVQVCCGHGVLVCILPILVAEGCRDLTSFLVRFLGCLGDQPLVVVYDNACHAAEHFENRYPEFASRIVWCIDRCVTSPLRL